MKITNFIKVLFLLSLLAISNSLSAQTPEKGSGIMYFNQDPDGGTQYVPNITYGSEWAWDHSNEKLYYWSRVTNTWNDFATLFVEVDGDVTNELGDVFEQPGEPTTFKKGDIWVDTDDEKTFAYDGTKWVELPSGGSAGDVDWHEWTSATAPDDINDDIVTQGKVAINTTNPESNYQFQVHGPGVLFKNLVGNAYTTYQNASVAWRFQTSNTDFKLFPILAAGDFRLQDQNGVADLFKWETSSGDYTMTQYPSTRDDSGTTTPDNFLYTDANGKVLSSPVSFLSELPNLPAYDDHTAAYNDGLVSGNWFKASSTNSMGLPVGTTIILE